MAVDPLIAVPEKVMDGEAQVRQKVGLLRVCDNDQFCLQIIILKHIEQHSRSHSPHAVLDS